MARSVEKRAATVEEATAAAMTELGLGPDDVEVEVLASPRRGLFGGGRRAHVRVIERAGKSDQEPDQQRTSQAATDSVVGPSPDRPAGTAEAESEHQEPDVTDTETGTATGDQQEQVVRDAGDPDISPEERADLLDEEADLAADFVEGLLDLLDLPGDIEIEVQEEQAVVNVSDVGSGLLIGRRGATLEALQELVRCATQRQTERRSYVRVDVEGYRARQLEKLRAKCRDGIAQVRETGEPVRLEPMDAYERKMMHDLVARTGGVTSSSEGSEPKRRVVIHPAE